jgi:SAM-dependent methyltransferase
MRGMHRRYWRAKFTGLFPRQFLDAGRSLKTRFDVARTRGDAVWCPVCEHSFSRFLPYNDRPTARCPNCRSLERHRYMFLFFERATDLRSTSRRLLHFAPERQLEHRLRGFPQLDYTTADLLRDDVDVRLDVTEIDLPDHSFDAVLCSHVLEHVTDDRAAMKELRRIVKPGGWAILDAPVEMDREDTFEDWHITSPADREKVFGQWDHVRIYGRNFPGLLTDAGWLIDEDPVPLSTDEAARFGVDPGAERLYVGRVSSFD